MDFALTLSGLMAAFVACAAWATRPPGPPERPGRVTRELPAGAYSCPAPPAMSSTTITRPTQLSTSGPYTPAGTARDTNLSNQNHSCDQ